jgi:hypothetical protein
MKFFESHYDEYVKEVEAFSLHPHIKTLFSTFPKNVHDLQNVILYGPKGVGKYSQSLYLISKYSPSQLKYEKRIAVSYNKETFFVKISDIHFEVDMALLGCNSKHIWNEIYNQIIDIVSSRTNNTAIIMCKNFHKIHSELLETFYSYMHDIEYVNLKFVIITDSVSFIPDNITHRCQIIHFKRPTMSAYNKCLFVVKPTEHVQQNSIDDLKTATENIIVKSAGGTTASLYKPLAVAVAVAVASTSGSAAQTHPTDIFQVLKKSPVRITSEFELHNITNIKSLKANITELMIPHENICNQIIEIIKTPTIHLKFDILRDLLYDLLIYDIDIQECIWFILEKLIQDGLLRREYMDDIMIKMFTFLQYFNNNYRPIYHLENFVLILICKIHGYKHIHPDVKQ